MFSNSLQLVLNIIISLAAGLALISLFYTGKPRQPHQRDQQAAEETTEERIRRLVGYG